MQGVNHGHGIRKQRLMHGCYEDAIEWRVYKKILVIEKIHLANELIWVLI